MNNSISKISGMKQCQIKAFQTMIKQLKEKGNKIIFLDPEKEYQKRITKIIRSDKNGSNLC